MSVTRSNGLGLLPTTMYLFTAFSLIGCGPTFVGTLVVTTDTEMTETVIGQVEIAADNVTLDCKNYPILNAGTAVNCRGGGTRSCGVKIENRSNVTLYNCDVYGFDDGIWISGSTQIHVEGSLATLNEVGYRIEDSSSVDVVRSTAINNLSEGFSVRRSTDGFFWLNSAVQNEGDGFDENDGSSAYYLRNDSYNNGLNGFEIDFAPTPTYWENWAFANGQNGISLDAISEGLLHDNDAIGSGNDGLRLDDEGGIGTTNCVVEDNYSSANGGNAAHQCGNLCTGNVYTNNQFVGPTNNIP